VRASVESPAPAPTRLLVRCRRGPSDFVVIHSSMPKRMCVSMLGHPRRRAKPPRTSGGHQTNKHKPALLLATFALIFPARGSTTKPRKFDTWLLASRRQTVHEPGNTHACALQIEIAHKPRLLVIARPPLATDFPSQFSGVVPPTPLHTLTHWTRTPQGETR